MTFKLLFFLQKQKYGSFLTRIFYRIKFALPHFSFCTFVRYLSPDSVAASPVAISSGEVSSIKYSLEA